MTAERFRVLLQAYGADIAHWPASEQLAANKLKYLPEFAFMLRVAEQLDEQLADFLVADASDDLVEKIMAAAPKPVVLNASVLDKKTSRWLLFKQFLLQSLSGVKKLNFRITIPNLGLKISGLGLASTGLAGVAVGVLCVAIFSTHFQPSNVNEESIDGSDFGQDWR